MRVSDKAKIRQRRIAHGALILVSFSLMFLGKADLTALRNLRTSSGEFLAPVVDVVSSEGECAVPCSSRFVQKRADARFKTSVQMHVQTRRHQ